MGAANYSTRIGQMFSVLAAAQLETSLLPTQILAWQSVIQSASECIFIIISMIQSYILLNLLMLG